MKNLILIILLSFSFLISSNCQTIESIHPKIQIKFINESNNPVSNVPVEIVYMSAPRSMHYITDEKGLITVPLVILDNYSEDTVYSCWVNVHHNDYQKLAQEIKLTKDSLEKGYIKSIGLQKMSVVKLNEDQFDNLTGMISLKDFAKKDTLFLYQSHIKRAPPKISKHPSIKLVKLSENIFKLDLYGYDISHQRHYKEQKLVKIKLKKRKAIIQIDGLKFEFYLKTLKDKLEYGNEYRFMLILR